MKVLIINDERFTRNLCYAFICVQGRKEMKEESYEQLRVNASSFIFDTEFIETSYSRNIMTIKKKAKEIKRVA